MLNAAAISAAPLPSWRTTSISVPVADVYKKFPTDPLVWQSAINERVQTELANVTQRIEAWQNFVNTNDNQFVSSFDPYQKVKDALKIDLKKYNPTGTPITDILLLVPVDKPDVSKLFQAGFLTTWIDKYSWQVSVNHVSSNVERLSW
jgi:hypothetical protein